MALVTHDRLLQGLNLITSEYLRNEITEFPSTEIQTWCLKWYKIGRVAKLHMEFGSIVPHQHIVWGQSNCKVNITLMTLRCLACNCHDHFEQLNLIIRWFASNEYETGRFSVYANIFSNRCFALKCDRRRGNSTAPVACHSDWATQNTNLAASRLDEILGYLTRYWNGLCVFVLEVRKDLWKCLSRVFSHRL